MDDYYIIDRPTVDELIEVLEELSKNGYGNTYVTTFSEELDYISVITEIGYNKATNAIEIYANE